MCQLAGEPADRGALREVQEAFNAWSTQSGLPKTAVSMVLACSVGEVYEGSFGS